MVLFIFWVLRFSVIRGLIYFLIRLLYQQYPMSSKPNRTNSPSKATSPAKAESKPTSPPKNAVQPAKGKPAEQPKQKAPEPVKPKAPEPAKKPASEPPKKGAFDAKAYAKNGVSIEEVQAAKASFDLFDSDQGGTVDIKELKAAMVSLGFQSKSGAIFQMISDLDSDGNGTIDFQEWLNLLTKKVNDRDSRENIRKIFYLFDDQKTGFIAVQNLQRIAQELGENVSLTELHEFIARADLDHDGVVSQQEFYTIMTRKIKE